MAKLQRVSFSEEIAKVVSSGKDGGNHRKSSAETIHSGHFMVSEVHTEQKPGAYDFSKAIKDTVTNYNFSRQRNAEIEASLSKLFECLTIAFSGNVVSPKWKTFKGMKLNIQDKIRLNNAIWRAWHIQFKQNKKPIVCQFATPHTDHIHATTQAVVLEGKYWKRTLDTVVQEYKRWRIFFKEKNSKDPHDDVLLDLKNRAELLERQKEAEGTKLYTPTTQPAPSPMIIDGDHDLLSEFTDTLFSSLSNQPFFPSSREMAYTGNADMIQPGLVQLQPNLDEDFMDTTFEPLQDFLEKVQNSVNQIPGTFVFMGNNSSFLTDINNSQQQPSQVQVAGNSNNMAFEDNTLTQPINLPLEDAISQLTGSEQQQQQQQPQPQQQQPQPQPVQQTQSQPLQVSAAQTGTSLQQFITTPMSIPSSFLTGSYSTDQGSAGMLASSPPSSFSSLTNLQFQPLGSQLSQPAIQVNQASSSIQVKPTTTFTVVTQIPTLLTQTPLLQQKANQLSQSGLNLNQQTQQPQQITVGSFSLGQQQPQLQQTQDLTGQSQAISLLQQAIELAGRQQQQSQTFPQIQPQQTFARSEKKPLVSELLAQSRTQRAAGFTLAQVPSQQTQVTQSSLTQPSQITQISQTLPQTVQVTNSLQQPSLTTQTVLQGQLAGTLQQPVFTQGLLQPQQQQQQQQQQTQQQQAPQQTAFPTAIVATTVAPATVVLPAVNQQPATTSNNRNRRGSGGSSQNQSSSGKTKASPVRPKQPMKIAPAPSPTPAILTSVNSGGISVTSAQQSSSNAFLAQLLTTGTYPGQVGVHTISTPATVATVPPSTSSTTVLLQPIKSELTSNAGSSCAMNTSGLQSTLSSTQQGLIISGSQLSDLSSTLLLSSTTGNTATSPVGQVNEVTVKSSSVVTNANTITTATPQVSSTVKGSLLSGSTSPTTSTLFSSDAANTSTSTVNTAELEEGSISNTVEDDDEDELKTTDSRRTSHISAEQKRRVNIKAGFDTLQNLIPALSQNPNQKVSKASMLQKAVEYTTKLKNERCKMQDEAAGLKAEIQKLNAAINNTQAQLPATGVPVTKQRFDQMSAMFDDYVQTRTGQNWKFWIFSIIIRPLFESYNGMVSTASIDELCRTVLAWLDQHCSLTRLRPAVLSSLRQLSTTTSILSDPSLVPEQAAQAVRRPQNPGNTGST